MRVLSFAAVLICAFGVLAARAQQKPAPADRSELARALGELPKPGNLGRCPQLRWSERSVLDVGDEGEPTKS